MPPVLGFSSSAFHAVKSHLPHTGFSLGSNVQGQTKGIWMWCMPHPRQPGHTLVLLDTEGLGDPNKVGARGKQPQAPSEPPGPS